MSAQNSKALIALSVFALCSGSVLFVLGLQAVIHKVGGAYQFAPEDAPWALSKEAQALVDKAYEGLGGQTIIDHHAHVVSLGQRSGPEFTNRSFVNPEALSWLYPRQRLRSSVYFSAAGIEKQERADDMYLARLVRLARALPEQHQLQLLALDQRYSREGEPLPKKTALYVDNDYVWYLSQEYPELFRAAVSVHPYRSEAIEALEKWAKRGVKTVKWLPNIQGFDPADEQLEPYYKALIDNKMTLLTHTGEEHGVSGGEPAFGNPLRYRKALTMGVKIIMAHCASDGVFSDPDDGQAKPRPGYEWFLQLLADPDLGKNLYGDISGLTHRNRVPSALAAILQHPQSFEHLLYASDYPLPAVNAVVEIDALVEGGFVTAKQAPALREIYNVNPLLFDFVLKRLARLPHTDLGLPDAVFTRAIDAK